MFYYPIGKEGESPLHSFPKYVIEAGAALSPQHTGTCFSVQTFMCSQLTGS